MHNIIVWYLIALFIINNQILLINAFKSKTFDDYCCKASFQALNEYNRFRSDQKKVAETEIEALLAQGQEKCTGRRCIQSDQCCPGSVCVDVDGIAGTCLPIYGVSEGETCNTDDDCEAGLSCAFNVNYVINPSTLYQVKNQRSCQAVGREMMKKQYNNDCQTSSECDSSRGLCCQLIKRHRQAPRKLCYYFSDPQSCIGAVDVTYAKTPLHHSPANVFFKARIG